MEKFKVGDRVRVARSSKWTGFTAEMRKYIGKEFTIASESNDDLADFGPHYSGPETDNYWFPAESLELITDPVDNSERDELAKQFMLHLYDELPDGPLPYSGYHDMCSDIAGMAFDLADAYMAEKARRNNP